MKLLLFFLLIVKFDFLLILASTSFAEEMVLSWDQNQEEELAGYKVYYGNNSGVYFDDPFTLPKESLKEIDGRVSYQFPISLTPELNYYFSVTAYDIWGYETGFSNEVQSPLLEGETDNYIIINNNDLVTYSRDVTLTLFASENGVEFGESAQVTFSNDYQEWSDPEPYAITKLWTLSPGEGVKTVYVKFMDSTGNWIAEPVKDQIIYEESKRSCDNPQRLLPVSVIASSELLPFFSVKNVFDGDPLTKWSSRFSFVPREEFITLDLGEPKSISSFGMYASKLFGTDYFPADFQIQESRDNLTWITINNVEGYVPPIQSPYLDNWDMSNLTGRYIRVYITRAKKLLFFFRLAQIAEIEVYGCDIDDYFPRLASENELLDAKEKKEISKTSLGEVINPDQRLPSIPGRPEVEFK